METIAAERDNITAVTLTKADMITEDKKRKSTESAETDDRVHKQGGEEADNAKKRRSAKKKKPQTPSLIYIQSEYEKKCYQKRLRNEQILREITG
jgi:hypothetical protein